MVEIQIRILQMLQDIRTDFLTAFFTAITMMAEEVYITLFIAIFYWCIDKKRAVRLGYFVLFNSVFNSVIKSMIKMPRPFNEGVVTAIRKETATGFSFPSGHTQTATGFWTGSMIILKTKASVIVGSVMILFVAFSRMYLGVHWPMDVLGGILFGLIFTYFANETLDEEGKMQKMHVLISSVAVLIVLIFPLDTSICKAVASLWALCFGGFLEQNYVKFKEKQAIPFQLVKVIIGILGLWVIYQLTLPMAATITRLYVIIRNAAYILWLIVGAPWCFKNLLRDSK